MATCMFPFSVERKFYTKQEDRYVQVPCGRCPACLQRRASIWGFRLKKQELISDNAMFVTLTYNDEHLPRTANNFRTLRKTDVQKFFKRLRRNRQKECDKHQVKNQEVKYYACGEYGGDRKRPHYHIIMFNAYPDEVTRAWRDDSGQEIGYVDFGTVTGASIGYTVKYINKGRWKPMHVNDDREPEFALMSKRMGENYLTEAVRQHHWKNVEKAYLTLEDGVKMAMPRYYKDKLWPREWTKTFVKNNPSVLLYPEVLEHSEKQRKKQAEFVEQLKLEDMQGMTDLELFESRKAEIENFKQKHLKRKDL